MHYFGLGGFMTPALFPAALIILIAWNLVWKGFALWHAARRDDRWWFVAFLIINTLGILEIIYLYFVAKVPPFRSQAEQKT